MSRIRSIHPGLWTDEDFIELSDPAKLLYLGLSNEADDHGVFEWKPLRIKMKLRAWDGTQTEPLIEEMEKQGMVARFDFGGKLFGAIKGFCKWQRPKSPQYLHPCPDVILEFVRAADRQTDKPDRGTALGKLLCERQGAKCFYCEEPITFYRKKLESLEVDHRLPISRGGEDDIGNLAASCKPCNSLKGAMTEGEFRARFNVGSLIANCRDKRNSHGAKILSRGCENEIRASSLRSQNQMEEGGGSGREEKSSNEDSSAEADKPLTVDEIVDAWNERMAPQGFPAVRKLTDTRRKQIKARIRENTLEEWQQAMSALERSEFCRGNGPNGWRADFDFLLQPKSFTKLLEGAYDH